MSSRENDIIFNVRELLEPILLERDLELYDVEFKGQGKNGVLRVFIDKEDGVTIDDCAHVSRELGTLLDIHDVIPDSYTLEVSSPGLTRELRNPDDFRRYKGKKAKIKTRTELDKKKLFIGTILDFKDDVVTIDDDDGDRFSIPYSEIVKANLELDF